MAGARTTAHLIKWTEDGEVFHVIALSPEVALDAYVECTRFNKVRGTLHKEESSCTLEEACKRTGADFKRATERFTGRGSKEEYILTSPRGMV